MFEGGRGEVEGEGSLSECRQVTHHVLQNALDVNIVTFPVQLHPSILIYLVRAVC